MSESGTGRAADARDTADARRAAGERVVQEMLGEECFAANMGAMSEGEGPVVAMGQLALEHVFGDIWTRPGLARRDRSLITLGVLMAQGHQTEIRNRVLAGRANGLSAEEILEAVLHTVPYRLPRRRPGDGHGDACPGAGVAGPERVVPPDHRTGPSAPSGIHHNEKGDFGGSLRTTCAGHAVGSVFEGGHSRGVAERVLYPWRWRRR
ncbi:carboxymuconolactone decarboxylase family protein [Streptomyces sp. Inha503]|uniref:carboxymuconolactone decarboxylase family protein n=1 Tax=Streptomyces sp. Inha503 TaxID=3383314 RepID=UPI0039A1A578